MITAEQTELLKSRKWVFGTSTATQVKILVANEQNRFLQGMSSFEVTPVDMEAFLTKHGLTGDA